MKGTLVMEKYINGSLREEDFFFFFFLVKLIFGQKQRKLPCVYFHWPFWYDFPQPFYNTIKAQHHFIEQLH